MAKQRDDMVELDEETERRLDCFAKVVGCPRGIAAARLLRDLLADEDFWRSVANPDGTLTTTH
jgi:predicted transcriptional regulator